MEMFHQYEHYRQLENDPLYLADFLIDVRMEEMSAYMPRTPEPVEVVATPQEPWVKKQWDIVNQYRAETLYLKQKLNEHIAKPKQGDRI